MTKFYQMCLVALLIVIPQYSFSVTTAALQEEINKLKNEIEELNNIAELVEDEVTEANNKIDSATKVNAYADVEFINSSKNPTFRQHHLSLFFKKQINPKWKFFSEIEFEDVPKFEAAPNGNSLNLIAAQGKLFTEAVNLDFDYKPGLSFRAGRFFTPAGIWSEDHYPPFVPTQERPAHIRKIFPQLVDGSMVFGTLPISQSFFKYKLYFGNGEGTGFDQPGKQDANSTQAYGLRTALLFPFFDYAELGSTIYGDNKDTSKEDGKKLAYGLHGKLKISALTFQFEYANATIEPLAAAEYAMLGWYAQMIFDVQKFSFGGRTDFYDENDSGANDKETNTLFANYHVDQNLLIKFEQHFISVETKEDTTMSIISLVYYID